VFEELVIVVELGFVVMVGLWFFGFVIGGVFLVVMVVDVFVVGWD